MTDPKTSSYGTSTGVAAFVPRYATTAGDFSTATRPTQTQVVTFIDQVSSLVNSILGKYGFSIPVTDTLVTDMLKLFVEEEVAAIAEGINGSGRFGPTTKTPKKSRFQIILDDVQEFVEENAVGIESLGASRPSPESFGIGFRDTNERGDPTFPIFQRDAFGADGFFKDYDSD